MFTAEEFRFLMDLITVEASKQAARGNNAYVDQCYVIKQKLNFLIANTGGVTINSNGCEK